MCTFPLLSLFLLIFSSITKASVPSSSTFKYVNEGELGEYIVEYGADYRVLDIFNSPLQLCFYNTSPNAYTLALRMGLVRSESLMRWVWEANRGNPVRENATLTLGSNGNLVLADADGRVAWQTGTANKGVVGFKLLPNGNMVLHDSKGKFIWQSFDHPTDTLLVGQSLRLGSSTKLVSRASDEIDSNGPYGLMMESKTLTMYYMSQNTQKPIPYYTFSERFGIKKGPLEYVTLGVRPVSDDGYAYELTLDYHVANSSVGGSLILARPKYNATLTLLRLGLDGNLRLYTYNDKVDWGAWEVTYILFSRDGRESECQLPERCGKFGLCEDNQCVGCPSASGIYGWSKNCEAAKLSTCRVNEFHYYKLEGVEHFMSKYTKGNGPMKEGDCGNRCTKDCKCLGYFYNNGTSMCWIAYELKTLTKVENATSVAYIKVPNKKR